MARPIQEDNLNSVIEIVRRIPGGARRSEVAKALKDVPQRTLQYWLKALVDDGRLNKEGKGPAARYRLPDAIEESDVTTAHQHDEEKPDEVVMPTIFPI